MSLECYKMSTEYYKMSSEHYKMSREYYKMSPANTIKCPLNIPMNVPPEYSNNVP